MQSKDPSRNTVGFINRQLVPWLITTALLLSSLGLGYLLSDCRQQLAELSTLFKLTEEELAVNSRAFDEAGEASKALTAQLDQLSIERQDALDRIGNLEVQRDNLRADIQRRQDERDSLVSARRDAEGALESIRIENLQLQDLPRQLESELLTCRENFASTEEALLELQANAALTPPLLTLAGISADRRVFAIQGSLAANLPAEFHVAQANGYLVQGRLLRREDELVLAAAERWHIDPSALVNGQKVFILPTFDHETH